MSSVVCKDINKIYSGGVHAVKNFNITIEDGEFIVLVGPSGCGKSTLLRMLAGLEGISDGELKIDDKVVNNMAPSDRDIAMVFQNYALYGNMTVYENMGFSLTIRHASSDEIHEKVMGVSDVVNLRNLLQRKPRALSGGQSQRVALGRAIVRDAGVYLMDEPLSNLDAKLRSSTRKELVELHEKLQATFVYVTHDQVEALTMADRIVVMKDGVAQQIGTPREVYATPANMFVGGFIGSPPMNFVVGTVEGQKFVSEDLTFDIPECHEKVLAYNGKKVVLGLRAENYALAGTNVDKKVKHDYLVDEVELLGAEELIYFFVNGKQMIARIPSSKTIQPDMTIGLSFDPEDTHFFDHQTQARIY